MNSTDNDQGHPGAKRSLLWNLVQSAALIGGTVLFCLVVLEGGLRILGRYQVGDIYGYLAPRAISFGLATNVSKTVNWPTHRWTVRTCDMGYRAKEIGSRGVGKRPHITVLGASDVFGNGLDYEQTFVGVLAEKLATNNIDVVNMGVGGHHLLEQMALFKEFVAGSRHLPTHVLIVLQPLMIGGYDDIHEGTIVRYGELFPENNWKRPVAKMILSRSLATYCFFRDGIRKIQHAYFERPDFSLDFYIERYSTRHRIRSPEKTADFLKRLKELETYIRGIGATPVCVWAPTTGGFLLDSLRAKGEVDGTLFDTQWFPELSRAHCETEGIQFINLEPMLQEMYNRGEKLNFDMDAHFNAPTSRVIGEFIYKSLQPHLKPQQTAAVTSAH
jgi:hypothetical protein